MGNTSGITFAQFVGSGTSGIIGLANTVVVPLIFALAFAVFIWGIVDYFFLNYSNETKREEGKQFILWGIVGMVVLLSVWGLVAILLSTLGLG